MLSKEVQVYLKTTETCNLNCKHCFTSGTSGAKIFFNVTKTLRFLKRLIQQQNLNALHVVFHGGEPLLAPLKDLEAVMHTLRYEEIQTSFSIQTNLVYPLTEDKKRFFQLHFESGIGTSWDHDIRFGSVNSKAKLSQLSLWENNVKELSKEGIPITLMVCLSKSLIESYEPYQIAEYAASLGIKYILFERITTDGNANENLDILPDNLELDSWLLKMYQQTIEKKLYLKIGNIFLNEIATSFLAHNHIGNRCRNCEQSLITINADGTLAGCPNSAQKDKWGHIDDSDLNLFLGSGCRINAICNEMSRNVVCSTCPVKQICNGDCYKLPWQGDICAAPKSLMIHLKETSPISDLENLMIN